MISVSFSICSFIYIIIFAVVYFSKKRVNLIENKVYTMLLMSTVIGLLIDIIGYFSFKTGGFDSIINITIAKIYLIYYFTWTFLLTMYVLIISFKLKFKDKINYTKFSLMIFILYSIISFIISLLPVYINNSSDAIYSYGPSVNLVYFISAICIVFMIVCVFLNLKEIKRKEYIPLLAFVVFGGVVLVIQHEYPNLLLMITCHAVIASLMYFTIENPDVQMVEELTKNRKLIEQNFEEKSNFLFKISQDLKKPLNDISNLSLSLINNTSDESIVNDLKKINNNSKQLYTYVNSALDVSQMDIKNLHVIESTYNANNFFEEIKRRVETELKNQNKNIEFRYNITTNLPVYLSGDNTKLKQIILSMLFDSIKHTTKGFIELDVNSIIKYGVCRLLIEISDCGGGMSIDKINSILNINDGLTREDIDKIDRLNIDLVLAHKMIKVLNGNFIIKSEEGHGTNFLIIVDQKIEDVEKSLTLKKMESYSKKILNQNKVLLISDDGDLKNKVINKLDGIEVANSLYVRDAIEKLNSGKIKCILIDDGLKEQNGIGILKALDTKVPSIILINDNQKFMSKQYINDGFSDFIIKEYIEDELYKIKKYL